MSVSTPPLFQCATCLPPEGVTSETNTRNLVVFIDGTSNKPDDENTNVYKLFDDVAESSTTNGPGLQQHKIYKMGIGAHYTDNLTSLNRMKRGISSGFEMAFARNIGENVKEAYAWLVDTYQAGDRIYLFGFSRGAYQVRALASMIHEIGLARVKDDSDKVYERYHSIDFYKPQRQPSMVQFRTAFCWPGVRIHFIGVWDTVSSLGLVKKDVHVTASASVTNACHFRHALSLDERRVKFIPEYFGEMNAHHSIHSPRRAISNIEEFWFPGSHSDVGGINRKRDPHPIMALYGRGSPGSHVGHASNASLEWMKKEAASSGLAFKSNLKEVSWGPQDVLDTRESMTGWWKLLEILPIRYQVSFSGTGEHGQRLHLCRPRSIIPSQKIHLSVFYADAYTPRATLGNGAHNSIVFRRPPASHQLDMTASLKRARTSLLELLLRDQDTTLSSLETVLSLIDSLENTHPEDEQTRAKPRPQWNLSDVQGGPLTKYALTVIYDATINVTGSESELLLQDARESLRTIFNDSSLHSTKLTQALYILRFSAKYPRLRERFIDNGVTKALTDALEPTSRNPSGIQFLLVVDSLGYLIAHEKLSDNVINQFRETVQTKISDIQVPTHLIAFLKVIARLAKYQKGKDLCEGLKVKLYDLVKKKKEGVGSAAIKALVAMDAAVPPTREIDIHNVLDYLNDILPPLDVEADGPLSPELPPSIGWVLDTERLNQDIMHQLVSTITSRNVHERKQGTLILVKLCKYDVVQRFCADYNILDVFVGQLKQKKTSLLAAYALEKCLGYGMRISDHKMCAVALVSMVEENRFDDAIGRVAGCDIFQRLLKSQFQINLPVWEEVVRSDIIPALIQMLAGGERDRTRMSLICIDALDKTPKSQLDLSPNIQESIQDLDSKSRHVRMRSVKVISALAQTMAGERAIIGCLKDIIALLPQGPTDISRPQIVGAVAVLYDISKNEVLREQIKESEEFKAWRTRLRIAYRP